MFFKIEHKLNDKINLKSEKKCSEIRKVPSVTPMESSQKSTAVEKQENPQKMWKLNNTFKKPMSQKRKHEKIQKISEVK